MDFELAEEQVMLQTSARDFLEKECPREVVRQMMDDEKGYPPDLWRKMAGLGWLGITLPEEYGGVGGSFLDLAVLLEETGRALLPAPLIPTLVQAGHPILAAGTEEQKQRYLPAIAGGDLIATLAFTEASGGIEASDIKTAAKRSGDGFVISGTKMFVPCANVADLIICAARTSSGADTEKGITLFLVEGGAPGLEIEVLKTLTGEKMCEVTFKDVTVPAENVLGKVDEGWPVLRRIILEATVAECARMTGGARWALDDSMSYARERIAFGRPIGSFQAIQHKLADMAQAVEGATSILYYAAWTVSENNPEMTLAASMAKSWCGETYKKATFDGVQIHGGIGFTWDHDMHLYFKRAKTSEVAFGDSDYHREQVARMLEI